MNRDWPKWREEEMVFQTEGTVYAKAWRQEGGQKLQEPGFSKECSLEHSQELIKVQILLSWAGWLLRFCMLTSSQGHRCCILGASRWWQEDEGDTLKRQQEKKAGSFAEVKLGRALKCRACCWTCDKLLLLKWSGRGVTWSISTKVFVRNMVWQSDSGTELEKKILS